MEGVEATTTTLKRRKSVWRNVILKVRNEIQKTMFHPSRENLLILFDCELLLYLTNASDCYLTYTDFTVHTYLLMHIHMMKAFNVFVCSFTEDH